MLGQNFFLAREAATSVCVGTDKNRCSSKSNSTFRFRCQSLFCASASVDRFGDHSGCRNRARHFADGR